MWPWSGAARSARRRRSGCRQTGLPPDKAATKKGGAKRADAARKVNNGEARKGESTTSTIANSCSPSRLNTSQPASQRTSVGSGQKLVVHGGMTPRSSNGPGTRKTAGRWREPGRCLQQLTWPTRTVAKAFQLPKMASCRMSRIESKSKWRQRCPAKRPADGPRPLNLSQQTLKNNFLILTGDDKSRQATAGTSASGIDCTRRQQRRQRFLSFVRSACSGSRHESARRERQISKLLFSHLLAARRRPRRIGPGGRRP